MKKIIMATKTSSTLILQKYRALAKLVQRLPPSKGEASWNELRTTFRKPLQEGESLEGRLKVADDKIAFLKMITPKAATSNNNNESSTSTRWIYKDGKRLDVSEGTIRDEKGRVISNWDGNNLDPCSVKRHNHQLKRAGFVNNAHAKGFF